jgi:hypothetical protein
MFSSQVIKSYELPYCTLEILSENRFRLLIENLDQPLQSAFQFSSDRAQLSQLTNDLQQQLQAITPPTNRQQETQPLYAINFPLNNQQNTTQLSWRQITDLRKILAEYHSDIAQNQGLFKNKQRLWSLLAVFIFLSLSGIIMEKWYRKQSESSATDFTPSSPPTTVSSPTSPSPDSPSPTVSKTLNLQLSDSLKPLDKLNSPSSVEIPPTSIPVETTTPPPPEKIPEPTSQPTPPLPKPRTNLNIPKLPSLNNPRKQQIPPRPSQPETLFDRTPQVVEVRTYFQQRWKPPENLKQDLEYQLTINSNGSLEKIVPLGSLSQTHLKTLPLPNYNERFVSSSSTRNQQKMRLVFRPSGEIKTFLIRAN